MTTIFTQTLTTNVNGYNGLTVVQYFSVAGLSLPKSRIIKIRVTFEAGATENLTITNAYIQHGATSGDLYDFSTTPIQLFFGGNASVTITAGQSVTSDWASFVYNKTSPLLVAFYMGGGAGADTIRSKAAVSNTSDYYKVANDAATVNKTGYSIESGNLSAINKIEIKDFVQGVLNII